MDTMKSTPIDIIEAFVENELEQRQTSGLPKSSPYVREASRALAAVKRLRQKGSPAVERIADRIREDACDTGSNDNEIEILGTAFELAMAYLTIEQAREVKKEMRGYVCSET